MKSVRMKFRLLIDAFLIIVFAFLYKKNAISLPFHEGAGLAILVLSLLHFLIGSRFVTSVTKRLCNHTTPWLHAYRLRIDQQVNIPLWPQGILDSNALLCFSHHADDDRLPPWSPCPDADKAVEGKQTNAVGILHRYRHRWWLWPL